MLRHDVAVVSVRYTTQPPTIAKAMKSLKKSVPVSIRYMRTDITKAKKAARIISKQRGEIVGFATLLREQSLRGVDVILAREASPDLPDATPDRRTA